MQAKCYCPTHGKLEFEEIVIKSSIPLCIKCSSELRFGNVRPRFDPNGTPKKKKH